MKEKKYAKVQVEGKKWCVTRNTEREGLQFDRSIDRSFVRSFDRSSFDRSLAFESEFDHLIVRSFDDATT